MKTVVVSTSHPDMLLMAIEILNSGGLIAIPTDTVYGLGALAFDGRAVRKIYKVKGRSNEKAIPILIGDPGDLEKVSFNVSPMVQKLAGYFWPGPMTLVVPKNPSIPDAVSTTRSVGVRVPNHLITRKILRATGPLAVTSANFSGRENPSNALEVLAQLDGSIPLIIDGGLVGNGLASTVVNCMGSEPVILREGPITLEHIKKALAL